MANKKTNGKDPAVLLYTQDFLVGTMMMSNIQKGKYITLLCYQHQKQNKLTLNDLSIAEGDEVILERFPLHSDGYYYNDRMAMEIENRKVRTDSSRKNGMLGGRPKKETYEKPMGYDLDNLKETYNKSKNNPTGNENENEIVNETVSVNVANKLLDKLLDITTFKQAMNDIDELGGIDTIFSVLEFDNSQRYNWLNHIEQKQMILA